MPHLLAASFSGLRPARRTPSLSWRWPMMLHAHLLSPDDDQWCSAHTFFLLTMTYDAPRTPSLSWRWPMMLRAHILSCDDDLWCSAHTFFLLTITYDASKRRYRYFLNTFLLCIFLKAYLIFFRTYSCLQVMTEQTALLGGTQSCLRVMTEQAALLGRTHSCLGVMTVQTALVGRHTAVCEWWQSRQRWWAGQCFPVTQPGPWKIQDNTVGPRARELQWYARTRHTAGPAWHTAEQHGTLRHSVAHCQHSVAHCQHSVAHCLHSVTHCQHSVTHCQLVTRTSTLHKKEM